MATPARDSKGRFTKVGARFEWDSKGGDRGIAKTRAAVGGLQSALSQMRGGASSIGGAAQAALSFAAPAVSMFKEGAGAAIRFEGQMSAVNAILQTDDKTMSMLEQKAKQLGASTKFTATEAAEGMEMLASSGFTANQIMSGIEGTLSLAAAGALKLSDASEITGNVINGMGLSTSDASHVADVLAKAAADSATNVQAMGVSFKYSAAQARSMGISLEENAFLLGAMADAGMKGSSGGTALQNMLSKIAKPTEKGAELFKKWNIEMTEVGEDGQKRMRPILDVVRDYATELDKIQDPLERAKAQEETWGKIGQKGYSALAARAKKFSQMTEEELKARSVDSFMPENVAGAAKRMADTRLIGVAGAFELLKSAVEGFWLELFSKESLAPMESFIKQITDFVSGVVTVLQGLASGEDAKKLEEKWGSTIVGIAQGVRDAMSAIREAFAYVRTKLDEFSSYWSQSFGGDKTRQLTKFIVLFVAIAAVAAPIIAVILGIGFVITSVLIPAVTGLGAIFSAVFSPVGLIIGGIALALFLLKGENESLLDVVSRVWSKIKEWALAVYEQGIKPFISGLASVYEVVGPQIQAVFGSVFSQLRDTIVQIWGLFSEFFTDTGGDAQTWGMLVGSVIGGTILVALEKFKMVLEVIEHGVKAVRDTLRDFASGNVLSGLARLGTALLDMVLEPFRSILQTAISIADSVMVPVPDAIRDFAFGGIGLTKAKERLAAEDEDEIGARPMSAPSYQYIPEITKTAADLEREKQEAMMAGLSPEMQEALEGALDSHEKKKKPCETTLNHSTSLDGREVARNQAKYKSEMDERAGYKNPPYQRGLMSTHGSAPGR